MKRMDKGGSRKYTFRGSDAITRELYVNIFDDRMDSQDMEEGAASSRNVRFECIESTTDPLS